MRFQKPKEPVELRRWRSANPKETDWKSLDTEVKEVMRKALARGQRDACCYCHGPAEPRSRIEHIVARDGANTFDWQNLALACNGAEGLPVDEHHCDKRKGSRVLRVVHPYSNPVVGLVRVGSSGRLKGHADQGDLREDVDAILNLNGRRPVNARRQAIATAAAGLPKGSWSVRRLEALLAELRVLDRPIPYQAWVERWLEGKRSSR